MTPSTLAREMAEEMNSEHLLDDIEAAEQIIQRRIEPLVNVMEAATVVLSDFNRTGGATAVGMHRLREALSQIERKENEHGK